MKDKILDASEELFIIKGFDNTSTKDIMEKAGIARGTLYNHFKSKEDVLDGVIERLINRTMTKAAAIAADKSIPVLNRMTMSILALNIEGDLGEEMMSQIHKPQNALMHQKVQQRLIDGIVPIMTDMVNEGIEQGIFHTEFPTEAMEMIMLYANVMFDDFEELTPEKKASRTQGFIRNTEKLLGTTPGALQETIMQMMQ